MGDEESKEAEYLFELVKNRYGDRLSEEELEEVKTGVEKVVEASVTLRSIELENADEPFSVFRPYRKEE